jgi:hypothetical protein
MNVATAALGSGTLLANVRYKWIVGGTPTPEQSVGVTQPDVRFSLFRIGVASPVGAEELIVFDVLDNSNWNTAPVL